MKLAHVEVLDDPWAEIEAPLFPDDQTLCERTPDGDVIQAALAALQASGSIEEFYAAAIRDAAGQTRKVAGCAELARSVLAAEEERHADFLGKVRAVLSSRQAPAVTDRDRLQAIVDLEKGYAVTLKQRGGVAERLLEYAVTATHAYWSYVLHRALEYSRQASRTIDRNDYEDGCLCLHLKALSPCCVVTNDRALTGLLKEVIALAASASPSFWLR